MIDPYKIKKDFPIFNRAVLKPVIEQINNLGLFDLSVELVRCRRKVGALRFRWVPKIGLPAAKAAKENDKPKAQQGKNRAKMQGHYSNKNLLRNGGIA